jgi:hypothetical protein
MQAKRKPNSYTGKGRHPLLRIGTPHYAVWETIVTAGNPDGGITAASLKAICPLYHPQVMSDLQRSMLVAKNGKLGASFLYVGDPNGRGIIPQQIEVEIEVYETDNGSFVTRTYLRGRQDTIGKITKYLTSRKIRIDIPGAYSNLSKAVINEPIIDEEPDVYELHKVKKYKRGANVIINQEEGCIIDQ